MQSKSKQKRAKEAHAQPNFTTFICVCVFFGDVCAFFPGDIFVCWLCVLLKAVLQGNAQTMQKQGNATLNDSRSRVCGTFVIVDPFMVLFSVS